MGAIYMYKCTTVSIVTQVTFAKIPLFICLIFYFVEYNCSKKAKKGFYFTQ